MENSELAGWDMFGIGYSSNLRFELGQLWTGDASLQLLGYYLRTILALAPLHTYRRLALIAHSMGGLIAQQALLEPPVRRFHRHIQLRS